MYSFIGVSWWYDLSRRGHLAITFNPLHLGTISFCERFNLGVKSVGNWGLDKKAKKVGKVRDGMRIFPWPIMMWSPSSRVEWPTALLCHAICSCPSHNSVKTPLNLDRPKSVMKIWEPEVPPSSLSLQWVNKVEPKSDILGGFIAGPQVRSARRRFPISFALRHPLHNK